MATVTLQLTAQCAGGNHFTLVLSGDVTGQQVLDIDAIQDLMNRIGKDELVGAILRLAEVGRTKAQLRTLLLAGITVTI